MPNVTLAAKRYDGLGTNAVFTGCIPIPPGWLWETVDGTAPLIAGGGGVPQVAQSRLLTVSLWNAAGTVEIGSFISALYPQHPPGPTHLFGSIKVLRVSATMTIANETELPLLLKVGTAPAGGGPTAHPTNVDGRGSWANFGDTTVPGSLKFPRLICCTDAAHLCASRVALGPLVPLSHPNLPVNWVDLFTNQFENGWTSPNTANARPTQSSGSFPTYKVTLNMLATTGDLNRKLCTFTQGSTDVTVRGSWPLPTSNPTSTLTVGTVLGTNNAGTQWAPIGTTITAILGPDTFRMSNPALRTGDYVPAFGYTHPAFPGSDAVGYNSLAPMFYRYMTATSGHCDKLRTALLLAQSYQHDAISFVGTGSTAGIVANYGTGAIAHYGQAYTDEFGVLHPQGELIDMDEYNSPYNPATIGNSATQSAWRHNAWMTYVLSGWEQPLGCLIKFATRLFLASQTFVPWLNYPWPNIGPNQQMHTPSGGGGYDGARINFRWFREIDALFYMLSLPFDVRSNQSGPFHAPTPRLPANRDKYKTWFQRRYWDSAEQWANEFNPADPHNGYLNGLWGHSPYYVQWGGRNAQGQPGDAPGTTVPPNEQAIPDPNPNEPDYMHVSGQTANFQQQMTFNALGICYMHILEDPRWQTKMGELADWFADEESSTHVGATPVTLGNVLAAARPGGNPPIYRLPYITTAPALLNNPPFNDASHGASIWKPAVPATVPPSGVWVANHHYGAGAVAPITTASEWFNHNFYTTIILLALLTWGWRVTGNAKLRDMADGMACIYAFTGADQAANGGGLFFDHKSLGEMWHMAYYAAAWRAGETWGVVAEGGTAPQPQPKTIGLGQTIGVETPLPITAIGGNQTVADLTFNVAKGRTVAYFDRVLANDPSTCALLIVLLATSGLETDAVLIDKTTLADVLAGATNEATNTGYARKVLVAADLTAVTVDHTNNRVEFDLPDILWANIENDGTGAISKLLLCFRPATGSADSAIIPLNHYDFAIPAPDGSSVTAQINAAGAHRAT